MAEPIIVPQDYSELVKREITIRRGHFINDFLENNRGTPEQAEKTWERLEKAKTEFIDLEERSRREILSWSLLEKPLRVMLEAEGWDKKTTENTVASRKMTFERAQHVVRERSKVIFDVDADFIEALDKADEEKLHYYLHRVDYDDFIRLAIVHLAKKLKRR